MPVFDIPAVAALFPHTAETMLLDRYLTDTPSASSRVFRVYRPTPAHFHRHCDEHLYVLSGSGSFWMNTPDESIPFAPGTFLAFPRETVHAMPEITGYPVTFLAIDTPRRQPTDIVFLDPTQATPHTFIANTEREPER